MWSGVVHVADVVGLRASSGGPRRRAVGEAERPAGRARQPAATRDDAEPHQAARRADEIKRPGAAIVERHDELGADALEIGDVLDPRLRLARRGSSVSDRAPRALPPPFVDDMSATPDLRRQADQS